MPWEALAWLLAFILQSAILGITMYLTVQLTDLESDFINPHEASKNFNKLVVRAATFSHKDHPVACSIVLITHL